MTHLEQVRAQYRRNFGPEQSRFELGADSQRPDLPAKIEIFIWHPDDKSDLSAMATCGLSDYAMEGGERAELHMAWEGKLEVEDERLMAEFLSNLALHPFFAKKALHWWQIFTLNEPLKPFGSRSAVLLHPPFNDEGWAYIQTEEHKVRIHNIVPIDEDERLLAVDHGIPALVDRWIKEGKNPFARD